MNGSRVVLLALLALGLAPAAPGFADRWDALGLSGRAVGRLHVQGGRLFAVTKSGLYAKPTDSADSTWSLLGFPGEWLVDAAVISDDTLLACKRFFSGAGDDTVFLWRTIDGGASWQPFQHGFREVADGSPAPLRVLAAFGPPVSALFGVGRWLEKSTNAGESWRTVSDPFLANFVVRSPWSATRLWAGGESNILAALLLRSDDGGETWSEIPVFTPGDNACDAIAFDPFEPGTIITGMEGRIMRSPDQGATWATLAAPDTDVRYWAVATSSGTPRHLYAGGQPIAATPSGVVLYRSDDGGQTWDVLEYPIEPGVAIYGFAACGGSEDSLYFGTDNGVFRYTSDPVTAVPREPGERLRPWLTSRPNPVESNATLEFELVREGEVSLRVLDLQGRVVDDLIHGRRPAGVQRALWSARGHPPGVYLCELRTEGAVVQRKLCVVR